MQEPSTRTYDVQGYNLRVTRAGKGTPLLVLKDFVGPQGWHPYMDRLAATHDVILPEHPGFGGQPLPEWLDNISDLANFYLDFLGAMGLEGVHLVGLGSGGWVAADLAIRNTSRLRSLVLSAPSGLHLRGVPQVDTFLTSEDDAVRDLFHDRSLAEGFVTSIMTPESEDVRLKNYEVSARLTWEPRLHNPHLHKWLHRIDVPTLLIWGAEDRIFPAAYAQEWQKRIPGAALEMLPNCGHAPQLEATDAFTKLVETFTSRARVPA